MTGVFAGSTKIGVCAALTGRFGAFRSSELPTRRLWMVRIVRGRMVAKTDKLQRVAKNNDILIAFGMRVRALRKNGGMSQEHLAELCRLDRTYVGGVERGERNVSLRNIAILARGLGVTISELAKGL